MKVAKIISSYVKTIQFLQHYHNKLQIRVKNNSFNKHLYIEAINTIENVVLSAEIAMRMVVGINIAI